MTLTFDLPESDLKLLHLDDKQGAERRVLELMTLEAYKNGEISGGKLGEMLGMNFWEREEFLKTHQAHQDVDSATYLANIQALEGQRSGDQ